MSSTVCRCYDGAACPEASSKAENFFADIKPEELSHAATEAVRDYIRLRELNGLCPDVGKWGPPPSPAAFLDSGLPKLDGSGSLPFGLSGVVEPFVNNDFQVTSVQSSPGSTQRRDRHPNSLSSPTWETEGPEGSYSQILSFDESGSSAIGVDGTSAGHVHEEDKRGLAVSWSSPELGPRRETRTSETIPVELPSVNAKQLLRSLRQESIAACRRRRDRQCRSRGSSRRDPATGSPFFSRPFSSRDDWDDTGVFTVAPRPKSVPCGSRRPRHALATRLSAAPTSTLLPTLAGADIKSNSEGKFLLGEDLWSAAKSGGLDSGFEEWMRRRRESGGRGGDVAVEFLDIREAALVSVAEALARRALPWQSQLCPRALQDLDIARMKAFHTADRERKATCTARQHAILRGALLEEERSWEAFARVQGTRFEQTLEKISAYVQERESDHALDLQTRQKAGEERVQRVEARNRYNVDRFEDDESDRTWQHRRAILVDMMWDLHTVTQAKQAEEKRGAAAVRMWSGGQTWATARDDAFAWLKASGVLALSTEELSRCELRVFEMKNNDANRAAEDRASEHRRSTESYESVLQSALEADKSQRWLSSDMWNLQGWLSVGTHKLVQQTLRALVRSCSHQYAVRNVLWEARQAAEFSASTRAAAASQRLADTREMCNTRRLQKTHVREHKRDMLQAPLKKIALRLVCSAVDQSEEKRASGEDAERGRAAEQLVAQMREATAARRREAETKFQKETTVLVRTDETARFTAFREEKLALAKELDKEVERVAYSVRERRAEEEEQTTAEVSAATTSLQEEQARADDREVLLGEMMLRERDNEERLLKEWLLQEEQAGSDETENIITAARRNREEERQRWIKDITFAVAEVTDLDTSFLQDTHSWNIADSPSAANQTARDSSSNSKRRKMDAIWAAVQNRSEEAINGYQTWVEQMRCESFQRLIEVADIEARGADARATRLEALAGLAREGSAAHWKEFWRSEIERARLAGVAGDMVAARWAQRQQQAAEAFGATWRSREWKSVVLDEDGKGLTAEASARDEVERVTTSASGLGGNSGNREERVMPAATNFCDKDALSSEPAIEEVRECNDGYGAEDTLAAGKECLSQAQLQGMAIDSAGGVKAQDSKCLGPQEDCEVEKTEEVTVIKTRQSGEPVEDTSPGHVHGEGGGIRALANDSGTQDLLEVPTRGVEGFSSAVGTTEAATRVEADSPHGETTPNEVVVFVGSSIASHFSTLRSSLTERVDRCRDSIITSQTSGPFCSIAGDVDDDDEAEWLKVLEDAVGANKAVNLAELGATVGNTPGGVAVLCLAHDSVIGDGELEGLVCADSLLPAVAAFVRVRRKMRAAMEAPTTPTSYEGMPAKGEGTRVGSVVATTRLNPEDLSAVATMEATVEFDIIGDELCSDLSNIFACAGRVDRDQRSQTACVRRALQKHSTILSPQSISALTALLSARGQSIPARCGTVNDRDDCSQSGDATVWRPCVTDALIVTRRASLEHAVMWAACCDIKKVGYCRKADAEVPEPHVEQSRGIDVHIKELWTALNLESGLGLSSLMLLAVTLPDNDTRLAVNDEVSDGADSGGGTDIKIIDSRSTSLSLMRLLSPESIQNVARSLPWHSTMVADSGRDTANGVDGRQHQIELTQKEILAYIPGHPAIGDLSGLDPETLEQGFTGVVTPLDVGNVGIIPPAALVMALQSGKAGFRLESSQACAVLRLADLEEKQCIGEYCSLGYPLGTHTVRYGRLVRKISELLRLVQASHRLRRAAGLTEAREESMDCTGLENAREGRRQSGIEKGTATFAVALEGVRQRMAYSRLQARVSMIQAPRLKVMDRVSKDAQENASKAARARVDETIRRAERRRAYTSAIQERAVALSASLSGKLQGAAATELWAEAKHVMVQSWDGLMATAAELSRKIADAEQTLRSHERQRFVEDIQVRELCDEEPEWWGEGLMLEVESSYRQEALWGQGTAEDLFGGESALIRDTSAAWEEDARTCKESLLEIENKLDVIIANFSERQAASREAINVARREKETARADFAGHVQTRHQGITHCREVLTWLGKATQSLEAECVVICERVADLPARTGKRLERILEGEAADAKHQRSVVARRLQEVSTSWREDVQLRKHRWDELRVSRRDKCEQNRSAVELVEEQTGPAGPDATAARADLLARGMESAGTVVTGFSKHLEKGENFIEANAVTIAASADLAQSHEAVIRCLAEGGVGRRVGTSEDSGAAEVVEILREDMTVRARLCRELVNNWWKQQQSTVKEALKCHEMELAERRTRRQVNHLLSTSLVTEIEARHNSNTLCKKTLARVLAESQRVADQFLAAERSAGERASAAATEAAAMSEREAEVLSLEAHALSGRVSTMLQGGLDSAAEDLMTAKMKVKDYGSSSSDEGCEVRAKSTGSFGRHRDSSGGG